MLVIGLEIELGSKKKDCASFTPWAQAKPRKQVRYALILNTEYRYKKKENAVVGVLDSLCPLSCQRKPVRPLITWH